MTETQDQSRPVRSNRLKRAYDNSLLLGPSLLIYGVFFVLPIAYLVVVSFWQLKLFELRPGFSLTNYVQTFAEYSQSILFTIAIALVVALCTTVVAYAFAYVMRFKLGRFGDVCLFITLVTLFGGYLVKIYAWKIILGTNGILNSTLQAIGLIDHPLSWLLFSPTAVIITLLHFLFPFAVLPIYSSLRSINPGHLEAARDLGASPLRVFLDIVLPQTHPGLVSAFALAFLYSAGDYVTPRLVGGPNLPMIGNFIESQLIQKLDVPQAAAMALTIMVLCFAIIAGLERLVRLVLFRRW